jgi:uncharacterized protein YjbI with pentapeptide repeats
LITVVGGSFANADFRGARLHNICFVESDLKGSDWRGARAAGVGFVRGDLAGAKLAGARMPGVFLDRVNLEHVNAQGADWSGGRFQGHWSPSLTGLELDRANLRGFAFRCGIMEEDRCNSGTPLRVAGADLTGASLLGWRHGFQAQGARLDRTEVDFRQLRHLAAGTFAGPLILRGGEARVEIGRRDLAAIVAAELPEEEAGWSAPVRPSFACAAARTVSERMICDEPNSHLRRLDLAMAPAYRRALRADPGVRAGQRAWLAARESCADANCVARAYLLQTELLEAKRGPPSWLRPGARLIFAAEPVRYSGPFRATALYRRIAPAIAEASESRIVVTANADGTIDARGDAVGGNAHACGLTGDGLRFDPATGWFSGPWSPGLDEPADPNAPPMRVLRFEGERATVFREGHLPGEDDPYDRRYSDYATCGARAGFTEMVRMPLPRAAIDRLRLDVAND